MLEKAQKYSGKTEDVLGKAIDSAAKEAPEVVHEYLIWNFIQDGLYFVIPFLVGSLLFGISFFLYKKKIGEELYSFFVVFGGASFFASLIAFCFNIGEMVQIVVAPRIYILTQILNILHR